MAKKKPLTVGNRYTRAYFGIFWPRTLRGSAIVDGENYLFVNVGPQAKYQFNEVVPGGVIHQPRHAKEVEKQIKTPPITTHVFVRDYNKNESDFEYKGVNINIHPCTKNPACNFLEVK